MLSKISSMLDAVADRLEAKGLIKEAYEIDKVADAVDKNAVKEYDWDKDYKGVQDRYDSKFYGDPPRKPQLTQLTQQQKPHNKLMDESNKEQSEKNVRIIRKIPKNGPVNPTDLESDTYQKLLQDYYTKLGIRLSKDEMSHHYLEHILTERKYNPKVKEELEKLKKLDLVYENFPERDDGYQFKILLKLIPPYAERETDDYKLAYSKWGQVGHASSIDQALSIALKKNKELSNRLVPGDALNTCIYDVETQKYFNLDGKEIPLSRDNENLY